MKDGSKLASVTLFTYEKITDFHESAEEPRQPDMKRIILATSHKYILLIHEVRTQKFFERSQFSFSSGFSHENRNFYHLIGIDIVVPLGEYFLS